jgi:hypothetical protein
LLPSKEVRRLAKDVTLIVVRREDSACGAWRKEFAVPFFNSWVVVLDSKGETLASWMGDTAGGGCDKDRVKEFPGNLVRLIRRSLSRCETVEELERRWRTDLGDVEVFELLSKRLGEMLRHSQLRRLCAETATDPSLPEQQRNEYRLREFVARASDISERRPSRASRSEFVRDGERLLVELAGHPRSADLVDALFARGYAHAFDVPGRTARALTRLRRASRQAADPGALDERVRHLSEMCDQWIAETRKWLEKTDRSSTRNIIAAMLGDAEAAIQAFSEPPYSEIPEYRNWLKEAKAKARGERQQSRRRPPAAKAEMGR